MPTSEQIAAELRSDPAGLGYGGLIGRVFEAEPEPPAAARPESPENPADPASVAAWRAYQTRARWERIRHRFGLLTPDAAADLLHLLTRPGARTRTVTTTTRGAFLATLSRLSLRLSDKPAAVQSRWALILTLATGGDDVVDLARPEIAEVFAAAVADSLLAEQEAAAVVAGRSVPCSRAEELGWAGVTADDIQASLAGDG